MKRVVAILSMLSVVAACSTQESTKPGYVNAEMSIVAHKVKKLIPYVFSPEEFKKPENDDLIKSHLRELDRFSHTLPEDKLEALLGKDPIIHHVVQNIQRDTQGAIQSFKYKNYKYARASIKNVVFQCFQCHTRTGQGVKYDHWDLDIGQLKIPATEKAELFIATRQFDEANKALERVMVKAPETYNQQPFEKEEAIKKMMIAYIRVQNDPKTALNRLEYFSDLKTTPKYILSSMSHWKKSLKKWLVEDAAKNQSGIDQQMATAKKLANDSGYDAAFVEYLRISSRLHGDISRSKNAEERAEKYFKLGQVYEVLKDAGFWDVPLVYYEACIKEKQKSAIAKKCFKEVEQEITLGFTGSAGTFIPAAEKNHLNRLRAMAGY
tara:strand:- start:77119 stop:78258 length:1140 start_codon:yes stop_codon:yes gene_type:complete